MLASLKVTSPQSSSYCSPRSPITLLGFTKATWYQIRSKKPASEDVSQLTSCVAVVIQPPCFSVSCLKNQDHNSTYLLRLVWGSNEIRPRKCPAPLLKSKCTIHVWLLLLLLLLLQLLLPRDPPHPPWCHSRGFNLLKAISISTFSIFPGPSLPTISHLF